MGCARFPEFVQIFCERQILWSLCSVDFHTFTLQLPIQTPHSVAPQIQVFVNSLENCQNLSKTSTPMHFSYGLVSCYGTFTLHRTGTRDRKQSQDQRVLINCAESFWCWANYKDPLCLIVKIVFLYQTLPLSPAVWWSHWYLKVKFCPSRSLHFSEVNRGTYSEMFSGFLVFVP